MSVISHNKNTHVNKVLIESVQIDSVIHCKNSFDNIPTKDYDMYHYSIKVVDKNGNTSTGRVITKINNLDKWVGDSVEVKHGQLKLF